MPADLSLEEVRQIRYKADKETGHFQQVRDYRGGVEFGKRERKHEALGEHKQFTVIGILGDWR